MKNFHSSLTAVALAKAGIFLSVFIWFHACSQSPAPNTSTTSVLTDSSAVLGSSPNNAFRLFKSTRQKGDQTETDLKILRMQDMRETLVSTVPLDDPSNEITKGPKFFWSKDSKYLIVDNSMPDSAYKREVVLYSLPDLAVAQRNPGALIGFDAMNEVVFFYRSTDERQSICFYDLKKPSIESVRDVTAAPIGKMPTLIFSYKERKVKVKAYTTDDTPVNFSEEY